MALLKLDAIASGDVISSKEIAEGNGIPVDLLGKVMQAMARAGIITAEHGARGGYRLARRLEEVSLGEVIVAIEGPTRLVRCQHDIDDCTHAATCNVRESMNGLHERLNDFIHGIKLDQLRRQDAVQAGVGGR